MAWHNSGNTVSGLDVGSYTVSFKDVTGWQKPSDVQILIQTGQIRTAHGAYVQMLGGIQITIEPEDVRNAGAGWTVDSDTTVHTSGEIVSDLLPGSHTIHFTDATPTVSGCFNPGVTWIFPADMTIDIPGGGTVQQTASYTTEKKALPASTGAGDVFLLGLSVSALFAGGRRGRKRQTGQ